MTTRVPVLPPGQAAAAVLTGLFLLFFGFFAYRATIVMYLALVGALVAQVIGVRVLGSQHQLLWGLGGALAGALIAVPVEVFLRVMVGVVSGAGLGLAIGMASGRWEGAAAGALVGGVLGGMLWVWIGELFVMAAFALLGAADALVGILSFMQRGQADALVLKPLHVLVVVAAALLGASFQYCLHRPVQPAAPPPSESEIPDVQRLP